MNIKGKKVLVTGAGGFIGSHLVEALVKKGCHVKAFVHYNSRNDWEWLEDVNCKDDIEVIAGDVRDFDSVSDAVKGVDVVFHLAALIGIPYSYVSPLAYIRTNVEGTYNILQASRLNGVKKVLVTSTSETYGTAQYTPIDEKHPLVGQSPYSASKIGGDQMAESYFRSFDLPVTIVRPFNTFGPRQSARAIIPAIISQVLSGDKVKLGNLKPTRDFTYVLDTVQGFIDIAESDNTNGEVINIGSNEEVSVKNLVEKITKLMDKKVEVIEDKQRVRPDKSEVDQLRCENGKLKKLTGWKPKYDINNGLAETIEWIKDNLDKYKAKIYNV